MKKILVLTDMDTVGSGYKHICAPLLSGLSEMGYEIIVAGLMYRGEEHGRPFTVVPAQSVEEGIGTIINLVQLWNPDVILVALDLPLQANVFSRIAPMLKREGGDRKYIAITPLENGPLTMSWAAPLFNMDAVFFISELGKQEAIKVGVTKAEHLLVGEDTTIWHPATPEEKNKLRDGLGIPQDAFVVLTVADNQERKNLWAGMKAISLLKSEIERPIRYILVTRVENPFGYKLRDLAASMDIHREFIPFERGLPQKDLWGLYAVSDVYLQPSKAEGLGLPVMDAMASGIPVVATDTGAMHELLEDGRGLLVPADYVFHDVWGNSLRSMISIDDTRGDLRFIAESILDDNQDDYHALQGMIHKALEYVKSRVWSIPISQVNSKIKELFDGTP